jgi:O-antigen/teichoic acid export membrane protein
MTKPFQMGRVGRHTLVYAAGVLLARGVSFVMLPFYTRYLTPADYGVMQLVELTLDVIAIFAGTQIASGVFRFYHKAADDASRNAVLSTATILLATSYGLFATATALAAPRLSQLVFGSPEQATLIRIAAGSLGVQSFAVVPLALLRLEERSVRFTYVNTAKLVFQLTSNILFLAVFGLGVKGIFISTLIANIVQGVWLGVPFIARVGLRVSGRAARDLTRYGIPLVGVNIATFAATFGDRYFLRVSGDMTAVGLYSLAYQFGFLLVGLGFVPFAMMWEPMRFEVAKRPDRDAVFARAFLYLNVVVLTMAVGIGLFVGDFLRVMSAPAFYRASDLVPIILVAYVLQSWTSFQEVGLLVRERTELATLANWLAGVIALLGYALLIPRWLGFGAAVATVLAFAARQIVTYVASQRLWPIRYSWAPVVRLVVVASVFSLLGVVAPTFSLGWSVALRATLFLLYLVVVWHLGVIRSEDRKRIRDFMRSPRRVTFPPTSIQSASEDGE